MQKKTKTGCANTEDWTGKDGVFGWWAGIQLFVKIFCCCRGCGCINTKARDDTQETDCLSNKRKFWVCAGKLLVHIYHHITTIAIDQEYSIATKQT